MVRREELAQAALVCAGRDVGGGARTIPLRRIAGLSRRCWVAPAALLTLVALAAQPTLSYADYRGHSNESEATAYGPLTLTKTYRASLQTTNGTDVYYFYASAAHQQIHISFTNTNASGTAAEGAGLLKRLERIGEDVFSEDLNEAYVGATRGGESHELAYSVPRSGRYYLGVGWALEGPEEAADPPGGYSFTISSPQPLLTRAQMLVKSLKQCKTLKGTGKRKPCEQGARKQY